MKTNNSTVYEFSGWFCCGAFRSFQHHGQRSPPSTVAVESVCVPPTVCLRDLQSMISPQYPSYRLETTKKVGVYLASSLPAHFRKQQKTLSSSFTCSGITAVWARRALSSTSFFRRLLEGGATGSHGHTSEKGDRCSEANTVSNISADTAAVWGGKAASSLRKAFNKIGLVSEEITSYIVLHVCPDVCFPHYFKWEKQKSMM